MKRYFKNKKYAWMRLGLGIAACSIFVAGGEFYLRFQSAHIIRKKQAHKSGLVESDPEFLIRYTPKGRRLIPNANVVIKNHYLSKKDVVMSVNSLGFRDDELPVPKPKNQIRILAVGDSITWGDYLQKEEVYVEQLQMLLNRSNYGKKKKFEVINAGVGDIGLKEEIDILEENGLFVQPDIVMVSFFLNDSRPPWGFPAELGRRGWLRRHSLLADKMYSALKLSQWVKKKGKHRFIWIKYTDRLKWRSDKNEFYELASLAKYDWGASWEKDSWKIVEKQFGRLKKLSDKNRFEVLIVIFPVAFQVYADFCEDMPQTRLKKISSEKGFHCCDLLPTLRKYRTKQMYFDVCHPTELGNKIIARAIFDFLPGHLSFK